MSSPKTYFIKRADTEHGPLTAAQVNRLKQRREITSDTPCRPSDEPAFRRLDEVLPHLKDQQPPDPAKLAQIKKAIADHEISLLTKSAFGTAALFWAPLGIGVITAGTAIGCGSLLLFKHRKPIGIVAMSLGALGLYMRFYRVLSR
jgi:hypothetical protein